MKYSIFLIGGLLSSTLVLTACGTVSSAPGMDRLVGEEGIFRDREAEYLEAETIPRLEVPSGMDDFMIDDLLVIPQLASADGQAFLDVPRPRPLGRNVSRGVVIQRMEDLNWAVIDASANQIWPRIREFWEENNIGLAFENPGSGVMETSWFVWQEDRGTREKIRVTVEPGFQDDSAEVRLQHMAVPEDAETFEQVEWPTQSMDGELEYELLSQLSTYLAEVAGLYQASSVSLMAGNIPSEGRATLITGEEARLRLEADYERSWAAIGRALERAGVEIIDQDESTGLYQVNFDTSSQQDQPGFFRRMMGADGANVFPLAVRVDQAADVVNVTVQADAAAISEDVAPATLEEVESALLSLISEFIS